MSVHGPTCPLSRYAFASCLLDRRGGRSGPRRSAVTHPVRRLRALPGRPPRRCPRRRRGAGRHPVPSPGAARRRPAGGRGRRALTKGCPAGTWNRSPAGRGVGGRARRTPRHGPGADPGRGDRAWSPWRDLETHYHEHGADPGTAEAAAGRPRGAAALWVGAADGVEVRVRPTGGASAQDLPRGLRVDLIDPGTDPEPAASASRPGGTSAGTDPSGTDPSGTAPSGTAPSGTAPSGTGTAGTAASGAAAAADTPGTADAPGAGSAPGTVGPAATAASSATGAASPRPRRYGAAAGRRSGDRHPRPDARGIRRRVRSAGGPWTRGPALAGSPRPTRSRRPAQPRPGRVRGRGRGDAGAAAEADAAAAHTAPKPKIVTRKGWGADESLRESAFLYTRPCGRPSSTTAPRATTTPVRRPLRPSQYLPLPRDEPGLAGHRLQLRHRQVRHHLRRPGRRVAKPVQGAHTLGFNSQTTGIAVLGTFTSSAHRRGHHRRGQADGVETRAARQGPARHGHPDVRRRQPVQEGHEGQTEGRLRAPRRIRHGMPGAKLYQKLGAIRTAAAAYQGRS